MILYIYELSSFKPNLTETQECVLDNIILHGNLFRGFSTSPHIMKQYIKYMDTIIGKYIDHVVYTFEIPDELTNNEIRELAIRCRNSMVRDGFSKVISCSEIDYIPLDNGMGALVCSEELMDFITNDSSWQPDNDIYEVIMYLFDKTVKYIPSMNTGFILQLRQFILDGMRERIKDFYSMEDGLYRFDLSAVVKYYIDSKTFLGVVDR